MTRMDRLSIYVLRDATGGIQGVFVPLEGIPILDKLTGLKTDARASQKVSHWTSGNDSTQDKKN